MKTPKNLRIFQLKIILLFFVNLIYLCWSDPDEIPSGPSSIINQECEEYGVECVCIPRACVSYNNCDFFFKYSLRNLLQDGTPFEFELFTNTKGDKNTVGYAAIGLSDDDQIEYGTVYECYLNGSENNARIGEFRNRIWNNGSNGTNSSVTANSIVDRADDVNIMVPVLGSSSYENEFIRCKFSINSEITVKLEKLKRMEFAVLKHKLFLLLARGSVGEVEESERIFVSLHADVSEM